MLGAAEGALRINDPIGMEQTAQQSGKGIGLLQIRKLAVKADFAGGVEHTEACHELTAEYAAENLDGQEKVVRRRNPARVVWGKAAGRDDTVDMRMVAPTPTIP